MILLIPYTRFILQTHLQIEEAEQRLAEHVKPQEVAQNNKLFSGVVENGKFNIRRTYQPRRSFHAIVSGKIYTNVTATQVEVIMRLRDLDIIKSVINILLAVYFLQSEISILLIFLIAFYVIQMITFNFNANGARYHLKKIFQVHV